MMESNCLNVCLFPPLCLLQIITISICAGGEHDSDLSFVHMQVQPVLGCPG